MSQTIISEWADAQKTQECIDANPELAKLAYEFCKRFGVKVGNHTVPSRLTVYTPSGLEGGYLFVGETYNREHKRVPVYMFNSHIVAKSKGSANSNRDTRDSTKITGLLKSIEKYNEGPTDQKLYNQYRSGIAYAFSQLGNKYRNDHVSSPSEHTLYSVFKRYLGGQTISEMPSHLVNEMGEYVIQVEKKIAERETQKSLLHRFAGGCTLIGWSDEFDYYLIGKTRYDTKDSSHNDANKVVVEDLKRYNNIAETPHAGLAVILKEYFKATPLHDPRNAFGYRRHDSYHEAVDVACGYAGTNIAWMIIPDEAPTV